MKSWQSCAIVLLSLLMLTEAAPLGAAYVVRDGRLANTTYLATRPVQEHFSAGMEAYHAKKWREAATQLRIVTTNFPRTSFAKDGEFYLAESYFYLRDYDFANEHADNYLKRQNNLKFFEKAICLKFAVAERFRQGARRRMLGSEQLPKILSGWELALTIYDEVIAALPSHDVAARAMFSKARALFEVKHYRESIETWQMLIKQFPKHEFAPESYVRISRAYLAECQAEPQNPDLLALAEINTLNFRRHFPGESRLAQVDGDVVTIKEVYAQGLYNTGQFYERIKKPGASVIYYYSAIRQFPDTSVAKNCKERLEALKKYSQAFPVIEEIL